MEYKETVGYQIGRKRLDLEWNEQQLADEVNEYRASNAKKTYSTQDIKDWEGNLVIPNDREVEALIEVLITRNNLVKGKEGAEDRFRKALEKTRAAHAAGKMVPGESYLGHVISELRGEKKEGVIAREVSKHMPVPKPVTKYMIQDLEHGVLYDKELLGAVLKVFTRNGSLSEDEAQALEKRYAPLHKNLSVMFVEPRNLYEAHRNLVRCFGDNAETVLKKSMDLSFIASTHHSQEEKILSRAGEYNLETVKQLLVTVDDHVKRYQGLVADMSKATRDLLGEDRDANEKYSDLHACMLPLAMGARPERIPKEFENDQGGLDEGKLREALKERAPKQFGDAKSIKKQIDHIISLKKQILSEFAPSPETTIEAHSRRFRG